MRRSRHDYFEPGDGLGDAVTTLATTRQSLIGDTAQARALILALSDQTGASLETQRAIAALLRIPTEALPPVLKEPTPK